MAAFAAQVSRAEMAVRLGATLADEHRPVKACSLARVDRFSTAVEMQDALRIIRVRPLTQTNSLASEDGRESAAGIVSGVTGWVQAKTRLPCGGAFVPSR